MSVLDATRLDTMSPEEAMENTERQWTRIARRVGEEKLLEAIRTNQDAWPTVLDPLGA